MFIFVILVSFWQAFLLGWFLGWAGMLISLPISILLGIWWLRNYSRRANV